MPLRAVKPVTKEKRLKMLVYGPAGVGKTMAAIQFPNAYIMDCEKGTDYYDKSITKAGSGVLQSNNPDEIREELIALLTTKHEYKTLIIDPVTQIYNAVQEKWTKVFERHANSAKQAEIQDFGPRYWGRVKAEFKGLQRILMALDMNVIITSHQKDVYAAGMQKIGVGPDTMKGDEYIFDLVFELSNPSGKMDGPRLARTIKERAEIGESRFPPEFEWSYEAFKKFYGEKVIERKAEPVRMARAEQVAEIKRLVDIVKLEDDTINKWFTKADVDAWEDMKEIDIQKCIDYVNNKIQKASGGK